MNRETAVGFTGTRLALHRAPTEQVVRAAAREGLRRLRPTPMRRELAEIGHSYREDLR